MHWLYQYIDIFTYKYIDDICIGCIIHVFCGFIEAEDTDMKNSHRLYERLASLGIMGTVLRAPIKAFDTTVL